MRFTLQALALTVLLALLVSVPAHAAPLTLLTKKNAIPDRAVFVATNSKGEAIFCASVRQRIVPAGIKKQLFFPLSLLIKENKLKLASARASDKAKFMRRIKKLNQLIKERRPICQAAQETPVPTNAASPVPTETPTLADTETPTFSPSPTDTSEPTITPTHVPTDTVPTINTGTIVPTVSATTPGITPTNTVVVTQTPGITSTSTIVSTETDTVVVSATNTPVCTQTVAPTDTPVIGFTARATIQATITENPTVSVTP
jgi:hypothetical protein